MAETTTPSTTFEDYVLEWLKATEPGAVRVNKVEGCGSDWAGDSEAGFYSTFSVDIEWVDTAGRQHYTGVEGTDMQQLWARVVGAWKP